ncbi:Ribonuclease H2 subunit A [Apophysomyces sp. BC1034]|nr:Ribonuclease H2 subunit A [Apophysomyces sp. BC1015]KAG0183029.1 Ribonuclease H2 subunit A [Apophysomyces sp. BC1021]KAG0194843.1 Ribonuclease H2 subunit A [Apophysomyces sp. BC1034]
MEQNDEGMSPASFVEEQSTRDELTEVISLLPSVQLPITKSYTYASPVPQLLIENRIDKTNEPCVLGVDEAGRGPCLGPMVYAVSYCPVSRHEEFKQLGFDDSKKLTESRRTALAKVIQENLDWVGWAVYVISPQDISTNMFSKPPFNLNEMAHDATIRLIRNVLNEKVNVTEIYVDPVGPSKSYQQKLLRFFPGIEITVEPKADALYPIVSAASICAKVTRDQIIQNWIWTEEGLEISKEFGSGYPSDPNTVKWLDENEDSFFGFPSIMRFSWKTISNRMNSTRQVEWSEDEDENPATKKRTKKALFTKQEKLPRSPQLRGSIYKSYCLESVSTL